MMHLPKASSELNARQRLSLVNRGYIKLQLASKMAINVVDVHENRDRFEHAMVVDMLACIRTRATLEMTIAHALDGGTASRVDLLVDSHITQLFGADVRREVEARCASVDALWGPTTPWPDMGERLVSKPVPYLPRLTMWERFVFLFRGRL